jgi:hypothetical protein
MEKSARTHTHTDTHTAYPAGKLPYRPPCSGPKLTPAPELEMNTTRTPGGRPGGVQIIRTPLLRDDKLTFVQYRLSPVSFDTRIIVAKRCLHRHTRNNNNDDDDDDCPCPRRRNRSSRAGVVVVEQ